MTSQSARMRWYRHLFQEVPAPVRLVTLALLVGGGFGGLANFVLLPDFWPWPMPALAYRFVAGAAAAYVVGSLIVFTRSRWVETELLMATVLIYGVALVAGLAVQPNLVDWSKPVAWSFVTIVSFAVVIALWYVVARLNTYRPDPTRALSRAARLYLLALATAVTAVGLLVWAVPQQAGVVWPWSALASWKLLDSRLIASMLLTVGGGSLLTLARNDRGDLEVILPMTWAYCLVAGSGIALHSLQTPAFVVPDLIYLVIFGLVLLSSLGLFFYERARAVSQAG